MAETITVNAVDRSAVIQRQTVEWGESAYLGEPGAGHFLVEDAAGTIVMPAHKEVVVEQDSSSTPRIFTGFVRRKGISRGASQYTGASREIDVATVDGNDLLRRQVIRGPGGKRPAETVSERVAWLLDDWLSLADVFDFGAVATSDTGMDKASLRDQYPGDILAACAVAARFNYYLRWSEFGSFELVFRDDNTSTDDTCTLSISNVAADHSATCLPPFQEAVLDEDGEHVYSHVLAAHRKGVVYRGRAGTADAFAARDGVTEDSGTRNAATAERDADTFLDQSDSEEQLLPVTLQLTAAQVGLVQAGMRISTRMEHMAPEGWDPAQYARILRKRVTQPLNTDYTYHVSMDLSPQEAGSAAGLVVQSASGRGGYQGLLLELPNPVTLGNHLIVAVSGRTNSGDPDAPNTAESQENFGTDAWTRFNGATLSRASSIFGSQDAGCAMFWKVADSTNRSGQIGGGAYPLATIWEVSGLDPAAATVQYVDAATGGPDYATASLGTVAVGALAFAVFCVGDYPGSGWAWGGPGAPPTGGYAWNTSFPDPGFSTGFVLDRCQWAFDNSSGDYYIPSGPLSAIGHAVGTGAALTPTITPGESGHGYGAVAVKVPAA